MIYRYLPFTLTLRAPAVFSLVGGDPNAAATLLYVPGSALRGAAARELARRARPGGELRELILSGEVRYLNAYPAVQAQRALPAPLSLRIQKHPQPGAREGQGEATVLRCYDLAAYGGERAGGWPAEQLAGLPGEFLTLKGPVYLASVSRSTRLHHQRDLPAGRAWTERRGGREVPHGALFAYESLDAGQVFKGLIMVCGEREEGVARRCEQVIELLGRGPLLLGRSRRAGYGGNASLTWHPPQDREEVAGPWLLPPADLPAGRVFRLLLTAPYAGRDPLTGQPDPTWLRGEVEQRLGGRATVLRVRWGFETSGGYNRTWALPLPEVPVARAGSVLVLRADAPIPWPVLAAVEHEGLGERRAEGFGRCLWLTEPSREVYVRSAPDPAAPLRPEGSAPLVSAIEERILEARLEEQVQRAAARVVRAADGTLPSASLLGRLRVPVRGGPEEALATLHAWLQDPSAQQALRRTAREQLERCRVGALGGQSKRKQRLDEWLLTVARGDAAKLAEALAFPEVTREASIARSPDALLDWLTGQEELARWRARLIDAVLAGLARRTRQATTDGTGEGGRDGR